MPNRTRDYGDLRVTLTKDLIWQYNEEKTGMGKLGEFYLANPQGEMRPVGSFGQAKWDNQKDKRATLLVGNAPGSSGRPAVARPIEYQWRWNDSKTGGIHPGSCWRPIPPSGYVSLGDVWQNKYTAPSVNAVWCVREDLTIQSQFAEHSFWDDLKGGGQHDCSTWSILPPDSSVVGSDKIVVLSDCHRAEKGYNQPPSDLARVLALPCPKDFQPFTAPMPTFTKDTIPEEKDEFSKTKQCGIELPFTAFFQPTHASSLARISDPFCRLERHIAWYVEKKHSNNGGGPLHDTRTITKGVSKSQSKEMGHQAGVEIGASFGVKALGMGVNVSLNYQFSYSQSSSFTEYQEETETREYTVLPYTCILFLTRRVWIKAVRPDGSFVTYMIEYNANNGTIIEEVKLK
ncbi:unnamed protein product [Alternaria alternata]